MKKRPEESGPAGAPNWIVTFTDMISLLLTFFILLLTFSSMEEEKFSMASGSLAGAFGVLTKDGKMSERDIDRQLTMKDTATNPDGALSESMREGTVTDAVDKIQNRQVFNVQIKSTDVAQGTRLRVAPTDGDEVFRLGTTELTASVAEVVAEIGRLFRDIPCRLVVEPHVDDLTWAAASARSPVDLTAQMGLVVAEILESEGVAPERIGVSPWGAGRPVSPNDTARRRKGNRRLEILVLPNSSDPLLAHARKNGAN